MTFEAAGRLFSPRFSLREDHLLHIEMAKLTPKQTAKQQKLPLHLCRLRHFGPGKAECREMEVFVAKWQSSHFHFFGDGFFNGSE